MRPQPHTASAGRPWEKLLCRGLVPQRPEFTLGPPCNSLTILATSLCQGAFMKCVQLIAVFATLLPLTGGLAARNGQAAAQSPAGQNDYPTATRADYVLGCMAANGNKRETLFQCSCAIDTIASMLPYSDYEKAETALSLQTGGGVGGRVA